MERSGLLLALALLQSVARRGLLQELSILILLGMITDVAEIMVKLLSIERLLEKSSHYHNPHHLAHEVTALRAGHSLRFLVALETEWARRLLSVVVNLLASIS